MADVNTTIATSGGDYASLALAEADDFGCTSGQSALCEYAEAMTDTTTVTINTSIPGSIEISVQSAYRHNGDFSSGASLACSGSYGIDVAVPVTISHLRIDASSITNTALRFQNVTGGSTAHHILIHDGQSGDNGIAANYNASNVVTVYRCAVSASGYYRGFYSTNSATMNCYFCTGYEDQGYMFSTTATMTCYGCYGISMYPFTGGITGDYNADNTSDSSYQAPGANSLHNLTTADNLTDAANNDFSVVDTNADIYNIGYDYGSPYTDTDIAGNSMSGIPDIGAYEYTTGSSQLPINCNGVLTDVIASALPSSEEAFATDTAGVAVCSGVTVPGVDAGVTGDQAGITSVAGSVIGCLDHSLVTDQAMFADVVASILPGSEMGNCMDDPVLVSSLITLLSGVSTGVLTDVAAVVLASGIPISAMIGNALLETGALAQAGVVILPAADTAVAHGAAALASVPAAVLVGAEYAGAVEHAVLVGAQGAVIAGVESLSVIDSAGLVRPSVAALAAFETLSLTDPASLTRVIADILTASTGTNRVIKSIFGTPVIIPVLSGRPVLKNKL